MNLENKYNTIQYNEQTLMNVPVTRVRTEHRVLISLTLMSATVNLDSTEPFVTKVCTFHHKIISFYMVTAAAAAAAYKGFS